MVFEVTPTRIGRAHGRWRILLVPLAAVTVVAAAVMTAESRPTPPTGAGIADVPSSMAPDPVATADPARLVVASPRPSPSPRPIPPVVVCVQIEAEACADAVMAALAALPEDVPPAASAEVSASLICGDDRDCPRTELRRMVDTVGSVRFQFDDGPSAWMNVISRRPSRGQERDPVIHAWVARWTQWAPPA